MPENHRGIRILSHQEKRRWKSHVFLLTRGEERSWKTHVIFGKHVVKKEGENRMCFMYTCLEFKPETRGEIWTRGEKRRWKHTCFFDKTRGEIWTRWKILYLTRVTFSGYLSSEGFNRFFMFSDLHDLIDHQKTENVYQVRRQIYFFAVNTAARKMGCSGCSRRVDRFREYRRTFLRETKKYSKNWNILSLNLRRESSTNWKFIATNPYPPN